ncbi:MAG: dTDP-4-dehydrorhamnose reductase [Deltaproteobacteria bacterium]|nr:dTDP-4-dehydrorhamnose reductase [Deltaproteobacteria bacterium]
MKILLTGASGMLASALLPKLKEARFEVLAYDHKALDITDLDKVNKVLGEETPDVIINTAAYTAVDKAESEPELASAVNTRGAENLAKASVNLGIRLIHISTDFVFDGKAETPYKEDYPTNPIGIYGTTKLDGEVAVKKAFENSRADFLIIRTSWLFGRGGGNFVKTIITKATELKELRIVDDQFGSPTHTEDLATAIINLMNARTSGIYHFSNKGKTTWFEFGSCAIELAKKAGVLVVTEKVTPVDTSAFPTPAKRPKYSVLDTSKYTKTTRETPLSWTLALENYIKSEW